MSSNPRRLLSVAALLATAMPAAVGGATAPSDTLRFFEGRTEVVSLVKVFLKRPYRSRTLGRGYISADGTLVLSQHVFEEGKPPHERQWRMRQVGPGRFTGTMSDAVGPVQASQVDGKFRFQFTMKGNLAVEQWVTPLPDGKTARTEVIVRRHGLRVARSEGTIRKL